MGPDPGTLGYLTKGWTHRRELNDGLNDRDIGRQSLTFLGDSDVVPVPIVIRRMVEILRQAHANQACPECGHDEQGHDKPQRDTNIHPLCHDVSQTRPRHHNCQASPIAANNGHDPNVPRSVVLHLVVLHLNVGALAPADLHPETDFGQVGARPGRRGDRGHRGETDAESGIPWRPAPCLTGASTGV